METQSPNREGVYFNSVTDFIPTEPINKIPSLQHFTLPQLKQSVVSDEHHITSPSKKHAGGFLSRESLCVHGCCRHPMPLTHIPAWHPAVEACRLQPGCWIGDGALSCALADPHGCVVLSCALVDVRSCVALKLLHNQPCKQLRS